MSEQADRYTYYVSSYTSINDFRGEDFSVLQSVDIKTFFILFFYFNSSTFHKYVLLHVCLCVIFALNPDGFAISPYWVESWEVFGLAYGAVNVILQGLVTQRVWQAVGKDSIPAKPLQSSGQSELGSALLGALLHKDSLPPPESLHLPPPRYITLFLELWPFVDCLLSGVKCRQ